MVGLSSGILTKQRCIKKSIHSGAFFLSSFVNSGRNPLYATSCNALTVFIFSNGRLVVTISQQQTPKEYTSALSEYSSLRSTSGAANNGVPTRLPSYLILCGKQLGLI